MSAALVQFRLEAAIWRSKIDFMMELTWLTGLVTVPLVFNGPDLFFFFTQPKQEIIHFTGLFLACLWVLSAGLSLAQHAGPGEFLRAVKSWFKLSWRNAYYWALFAFALFAVGQVVTWALSPLPTVSFLARDANDPGNNAYTILASLALFVTVALRLRRRAQVERLMWVVAGVGTLTAFYGILQFLGIDPVGIGERGGGFVTSRVYATFGNPIFFAAYLIFSITFTLALGTVMFIRKRPGNAARAWLAAAAISTALQFLALWVTDSRGPLVGLMTGLFVFTFLLLLINTDRAHRVRVALLLGLTSLAWVTNWIAGANPLTNPFSLAGVLICFLLAAAIVLLEAGAYGGEKSLRFWQWRFKAGLPAWWFWALSAISIALLAGYFFVYNSNSFMEDYVFIFPTALAFAMLLSWRSTRASPTGRQRRRRPGGRAGNGFPWERISGAGQRFSSPLAPRITLAAAAFALVLLVPFFPLLSSVSGVDILADNGNKDRDFGSLASRIGAEEVTLADELSYVSTRRTDTWLGATELLVTRQSVFDENSALVAARHIFGYGQEMYALAYPQTAVPQTVFRVTSNPHNLIFLVWLEHGLWGILSFTALVAIVVGLLLRSFFRATRSAPGDYWATLVASSLLALLAARLTEQLTGVARVSDLFLFWGVLGMALALPPVVAKLNGSEQTADLRAPTGAGRRSKASGARQRRAAALGEISFRAASKYGWRSILPVTGFGIALILAAVLFVSVDLSALYHSARAADGRRAILAAQTLDETVQSEYDKIRDAALAQPFSENYAVDLADRWDPLIAQYLTGFDPPRLEEARRLAAGSREALIANQEVSEFAINSLAELNIVNSRVQQIAILANDPQELDQAHQNILDVLDDMVRVLPTYSNVLTGIATSYVQLNELDKGVAVATMVVDLLDEVDLFEPRAHYIRALANYRLDNHASAREDLLLVLANDPTDSTDGVAGLTSDQDGFPLAREAARILALIGRAEGDQETETRFTMLFARLSEAPPPDTPQYYLLRGQIQIAIGNRELAVPELERAVNGLETVNEASVTAARELEDVLNRLGEPGRAECYGALAFELEQFLQTPSPEGGVGPDRPVNVCAGAAG